MRVSATIVALALLAAGCGSEAPPAEPAAAAPVAAEDHTGHTASRVFFVQPANGATVKSPVQFEFGSDQFTVAAVPAGTVTEVRAGMGHYHLGVDTTCLPAGQEIPKAAPWIHFGDGKNVIEMQLTPGEHTFAVQAGDDLHRTLDGLCETITINVTE